MLKHFKTGMNILFLLFVMASCGSTKPELEKEGPDEEGGSKSGLVSIAYLKSLYNSAPVTVKDEIYIEGKVASSDRYGNFHKTLCIEDETGGLAVRLDATALFKKYEPGTQVRVGCNTLVLGTYGGLLQLGTASGDGSYQTDPIPYHLIQSHISIIKKPEEEPEPAVLVIDDLSPGYISCFVEVRGVQFREGGSDVTWCDPENDTDRILEDRDGNELIVRTSRYAGYASWMLPAGSGFIRGVLSYFNGNYQLIPNNPHEAVFEEERF